MMLAKRLEPKLCQIARRKREMAKLMKKRIVLEFPIVESFERIEIRQATARKPRSSRSTPGCRLDRQPNSNPLHANSEVITTPAKLVKVSKAQGAVARINNHTAHPQRILVVEDEPNLRQVYSNVLLRSGYQVDTAKDGKAGWEVLYTARLASNDYDLLITDNKMPRLSGVELIRKLRFASMDLPVILASSAMPANTERLRLAAMLPKPFSEHQLIQTVREVLHVVEDERKEI
jgi:CheY-like chemotaxis protein